jgi:hypothetical protein
MDMNQVKPVTKRATRENHSGRQNEHPILDDVGYLPSATTFEWNASDIHSMDNFASRLIICLLETDHFHAGALPL